MKMLAIDLGASSGRGIVGNFDGDKLTLNEIHRFSNDPVMVNGTFHWDTLRIFYEISSAEQQKRILKRNGAKMLERFETEWIPKENQYFNYYKIKEKSGLLLWALK